MRTLIGFLSAVFFAGCSATYQQQIVRAPTAKLERDKGVFISTPKDGWYDKIEYKNSGKMTGAAIKAAFPRYSNNVYVSEECLGPECLKIIPRPKFAYYVEPEILH